MNHYVARIVEPLERRKARHIEAWKRLHDNGGAAVFQLGIRFDAARAAKGIYLTGNQPAIVFKRCRKSFSAVFFRKPYAAEFQRKSRIAVAERDAGRKIVGDAVAGKRDVYLRFRGNHPAEGRNTGKFFVVQFFLHALRNKHRFGYSVYGNEGYRDIAQLIKFLVYSHSNLNLGRSAVRNFGARKTLSAFHRADHHALREIFLQ